MQDLQQSDPSMGSHGTPGSNFKFDAGAAPFTPGGSVSKGPPVATFGNGVQF